MGEDNNHDNEVFIDADAGFSNDKDSYDTILLNQINNCVKVLSREMTGGQVMHKETKTGTEKYMEDVRELVINHVDTLRMLLASYIEGDNKDQLKIITDEINDYKKELMKTKVVIAGRGEVEMGTIKGMSADNPIMKEYINFKALRYRDIFEILIACYNKKKAYIRSLEEE